MAKLIIRLRPKIFLFENVRGLTWARWTKFGVKGEIWRDVQDTFMGAKKEFSALKKYKVETALLHARDYAIPQNRPRVFIVGMRKSHLKGLEEKEQEGFFPEPNTIGKPPDIVDVLSDLVNDDYTPGSGEKTSRYPKSPQNPWQKRIRTGKKGIVLKKGDILTEQDHSKNSERVWRKWEYMIEKNGFIDPSDDDPRMYETNKFSQRVLPKRWGNSKPNLTVCGQPEDYVHFSQPRSITVREWARLQTFPDWYQFSGPRTTGGLRRAGNPREGNFERDVPKYTQIGNAVPVGLAKEFGRHFMKFL